MFNNELLVFVLGVICAVFGFLINWIKSMAAKRMDDLEKLHEHNSERIDGLKDRVVELEHTSVKRADLEFILGSWKEDIKESVDKSFERVHERIDEIYNKTSNCNQYQGIIEHELHPVKLTKRPIK